MRDEIGPQSLDSCDIDYADADADAASLGIELKRILLRTRRGAKGRPKTSTIAQQIGASAASVYAYLAGTTLPPVGLFDDLLTALGASDIERKQLWELRERVRSRARIRGASQEVPRVQALPQPGDEWPKLVGVPPIEADCYVERDHEWQSLIRAEPVTVVLSGGGGVGKTQLAARCARQLLHGQLVDLMVWVSALSRDSVITSYAHAAAVVGLAAPDADTLAMRLLSWLETTPRRWLVVLDNVGDPSAVRGLWPPVGRGRTLMTTRRRDSAIRAATRLFVEINPFSPAEAMDYLAQKLVDRGETGETLASLAADLGHHPLALAQVCAYVLDRDLACSDYRRRFSQRRHGLRDLLPEPAALPDDHQATVDTIWSISVDQADELSPAGLARPALTLASVLDGTAIPTDVWMRPAALEFASLRRTSNHGGAVTPDQARDGLHNLARLNLVGIDPAAARVTIHALVQASVRSTMQPEETTNVVRAAADALSQAWPDRQDAALAQVLRANAYALDHADGEALWIPVVHDVIFKIGNSLGDFGHVAASIRHFEDVVTRAGDQFGDAHSSSLWARNYRAVWLGKQGDAVRARDDMVLLVNHVTSDCDADDPLVAEVRGNHAYFVGQAGDYATAIELTRNALQELRLVRPHDASNLLALESNIAFFIGHLGRHNEAAAAYRELLTKAASMLGADHLDTLKIWANAVGWRGKAGDTRGALSEFREMLPILERALGDGHSLTIRTRFHIARLARECDPCDAATDIYEVLLASERLLGWSHPHTLDVRLECALLSRDLGETADAAIQLEELLADATATFGANHARTDRIRSHLIDIRG